MFDEPLFASASPFQDEVLALHVSDCDAAALWYSKSFGMTQIERRDERG